MEKVLDLLEISINDIKFVDHKKIIINFVITEYEFNILTDDGFTVEISQTPFNINDGTLNLKTGIDLDRIEFIT